MSGGRTSKTKYRMPSKTWHCLTGQYLNWTKNRPTPQQQSLSEPDSGPPLEWKAQQKILWVEVKKETRRWEDRWKIQDLLADERCD